MVGAKRGGAWWWWCYRGIRRELIHVIVNRVLISGGCYSEANIEEKKVYEELSHPLISWASQACRRHAEKFFFKESSRISIMCLKRHVNKEFELDELPFAFK